GTLPRRSRRHDELGYPDVDLQLQPAVLRPGLDVALTHQSSMEPGLPVSTSHEKLGKIRCPVASVCRPRSAGLTTSARQGHKRLRACSMLVAVLAAAAMAVSCSHATSPAR